jgi:hypothetical protein
VGFAFYGADTTTTPELQAKTIGLIAGFTLGLERVVISKDIMAAQTSTPMPSFQDECIDLEMSPGSCAIVHDMFCDSGQQNSFAELTNMFPPPG